MTKRYFIKLNGKTQNMVALTADEMKLAVIDLQLALADGAAFGVTCVQHGGRLSFLVSHHGGSDKIDVWVE